MTRSRGWLACIAGNALVIAAGADAVQAENLHRKYGAYWNCGYISVGQPYYEICKSCEARGMEFFRQGNFGHCVPKVASPTASVPSPKTATPSANVPRRTAGAPTHSVPFPRTPSPTVAKWGAIAVGIDRDRVGAGIAWNYTSKGEAEKAALRQCFQRAASCQVVGAFSKGCGYVTTGTNARGGLGWGAGPSAQAAYDNCKNRGLRCDPPTGGCIN